MSPLTILKNSTFIEVPRSERDIALYIIDLNSLRSPLVIIMKSPILCFLFLLCSLYSSTAQWDQCLGKKNK